MIEFTSMQLLYGVTSAIIRPSRLTMRTCEEDEEQYLIDSGSIVVWENSINEYLERNKEQVVRELEFRTVNNLGYDFELFNQDLSKDTIKIINKVIHI